MPPASFPSYFLSFFPFLSFSAVSKRYRHTRRKKDTLILLLLSLLLLLLLQRRFVGKLWVLQGKLLK